MIGGRALHELFYGVVLPVVSFCSPSSWTGFLLSLFLTSPLDPPVRCDLRLGECGRSAPPAIVCSWATARPLRQTQTQRRKVDRRSEESPQ